MELIYGGRAEDDDGPDEQDLLDRDLASPEFAAWSALKEIKYLHGIIHMLPRLDHLKGLADTALKAIDDIDDQLTGSN